MPETNFATKAALLRAVPTQEGVRGLARELRLGPATVISLRTEMLEEGLIEIGPAPSPGPGRPRENLRPTTLGREYLEAFDTLKSKVLRSRRFDLLRGASDGAYAGRLASRGVSTADLFIGLNSIAERFGKAAR